MAELGRLITAMVTPFDADGAVDYAQAKRLAKALLGSGSDGVVISGTTGESPTLTHDEKVRLFSEIRTAVPKSALIAGTGNNDTAASIALTRDAERIGADAVLLVVPYYNKPTQEGLYRHFSAIAQATKLPCILYNVPSRTVARLEAETVARLSRIPNIVGIKEASSEMKVVEAVLAQSCPGFLMWSGNDSDTCAIMERGGYGVISVASHLVGRQVRRMLDFCVQRKFAEARTMHEKLMPVFSGLFVTTSPIPVKYALNKLGFPVGGWRLPLCEPDADSAAKVDTLLLSTTIDLPLPAKQRPA
ncbi:MAG: 4-hydroxy-tetrahydrodipicolinate synthase [Dehalococcoidia bacterium]|nr:4-hydroxy-tetrahydrodipicolinate synthase [Dehalococcoidia bacterium]